VATGNRNGGWESTSDRFFYALPWGVVAFLVVAVGGLVWTLKWPDSLSANDYLSAVGSGAGLLAVGHGIRMNARERRRFEQDG
jgi:hypothetical protein